MESKTANSYNIDVRLLLLARVWYSPVKTPTVGSKFIAVSGVLLMWTVAAECVRKTSLELSCILALRGARTEAEPNSVGVLQRKLALNGSSALSCAWGSSNDPALGFVRALLLVRIERHYFLRLRPSPLPQVPWRAGLQE